MEQRQFGNKFRGERDNSQLTLCSTMGRVESRAVCQCKSPPPPRVVFCLNPSPAEQRLVNACLLNRHTKDNISQVHITPTAGRHFANKKKYLCCKLFQSNPRSGSSSIFALCLILSSIYVCTVPHRQSSTIYGNRQIPDTGCW